MRLPHPYVRIDSAVRRETVDHEAGDGYPLAGVAGTFAWPHLGAWCEGTDWS